MKQKLTIILAVLMLAACTSKEEKLKQRAEELCRYIPDHELREESKDYMTADFFAVLDTMFNHLPEHEAMDHEWLHYFVTGNGGTIADFTVTAVEQTDDNHAVATICLLFLFAFSEHSHQGRRSHSSLRNCLVSIG